MRAYLYGVLSLALFVLLLVILYIGLLSVIVSPGKTIDAGAFTIKREVYFDAPEGRLYPAAVVSDTEAMTYTFTVAR